MAAPFIVGRCLSCFVTIATAHCTVWQHCLCPARSLCPVPSVTRGLRSKYRTILNKTSIQNFGFFSVLSGAGKHLATGRCMSKDTVRILHVTLRYPKIWSFYPHISRAPMNRKLELWNHFWGFQFRVFYFFIYTYLFLYLYLVYNLYTHSFFFFVSLIYSLIHSFFLSFVH